MLRFEHTYQFSEAEYVALFGLLPAGSRTRLLRRIGILLFALACLFSPYTFLLGIAILTVGAIGFFMPRFLPQTTARTFQQLRYLHGPITYGVDDHNVWVRTKDFAAEAAWHHVVVWRERDGWLVLQGSGFPPVILPITGLKADGIYQQVKVLTQQHAAEFGSRAARRLAV